MALEGYLLRLTHGTEGLLIRKLLYLLKVSAQDLHHVLKMQIKVLRKPLVDVVLHLAAHAPNLIIKHSYHLEVLCLKLRAFIIRSAAVCVH